MPLSKMADAPPPWLRADTAPPAPGTRDVFVDGILGGIPDVYWRYPSSVTGWVEGERYSYVDIVRYGHSERSTDFEAVGRGELYRLRDDPGQQADLASENPEISATLRERLLAWYAENDALVRKLRKGSSPHPAQPVLGEQERRRLEALGYVR